MLGKGGLLGNDARLNAKREEEQSTPRGVPIRRPSQSSLGGSGSTPGAASTGASSGPVGTGARGGATVYRRQR